MRSCTIRRQESEFWISRAGIEIEFVLGPSIVAASVLGRQLDGQTSCDTLDEKSISKVYITASRRASMRLGVILAGRAEIYRDELYTLAAIEHAFHRSLTSVSAFHERLDVATDSISIVFALNPIRDSNYRAFADYLGLTYGRVLPPPANEVAESLDTDVVLMFGLCGSITGDVGEIYAPYVFRELLFRSSYLEDTDCLLPTTTPVYIRNILAGAIKSTLARAITTNLTLSPEFIRSGVEGLTAYAKRLKTYADIVDKECYEIAKHTRTPLGILLMSSDGLATEDTMLRNKRPLRVNAGSFNAMCTTAIKHVLSTFPRSWE